MSRKNNKSTKKRNTPSNKKDTFIPNQFQRKAQKNLNYNNSYNNDNIYNLIDKYVDEDEEFLWKWNVISEIGRGANGVVYKVRDIHSHKLYALKVQQLSDTRDFTGIKPNLLTELTVLSSLHHPHISSVGNIEVDHKHNHILFTMPLYQYSLYDYINVIWMDIHIVPSNLKIHTLLQIAYDIFNAISYVHCHGWMHLDLKPENIMLDENNRATVIDFGLAESIEGKHVENNKIGTSTFRSPEILCGTKGLYGASSDVWSIGLILAEMFFDVELFSQHQDNKIFEEQLNMINPSDIDIWLDKFRQNYHSCPNIDINKPKKNMIRKHLLHGKDGEQFFYSVYTKHVTDHLIDLIEKCLRFNPIDRITCEEALQHPVFHQVIHISVPVNKECLSKKIGSSQMDMIVRQQRVFNYIQQQVYELPENNNKSLEDLDKVFTNAIWNISNKLLHLPINKGNGNTRVTRDSYVELAIMQRLKWRIPFL